MECEEYQSRRVKLGYVADCPHCVQLVDSIGNQVFDMLPVIQGGETDTSLVLIPETERLRYYPEEYTRTEGASGCFYDICMDDLAALIDLGDLRDVNTEGQSNGDTVVYNSTTGMYELFNLTDALGDINTRIDNLTEIVEGQGDDISDIYNKLAEHDRKLNQLFQITSNLQDALDTLAARVKAIEDAIYDWTNDKTTKIPRATINATSGGYTSNNGIFCRAKNQNNDIDFS